MSNIGYHGFHSDKYCVHCSLPVEGNDVPYCDSVCEARFADMVEMKARTGELLSGMERFVLKHGTRTDIAVA